MPTTIQVRRSTQSEWNTNSSVVLLAGEAGYETDTGNIKIGDGSTTWANLKYQLPYNTGSRDSALTSTLTIDNANDRVGIGASSPTEKLSVGGNATISGTLSAGDTTLSGDLAVNGGDITTTSGTLNVASTLTSAQTVNVATGVTANGSTKAINIGTGGASGSTTNVTIGSSTSGATGTATINNATTAIAGILNLAGNLAIATNKFNVTAASGNTAIAGTLGVASDLAVATNKFTVAAVSGNTAVAGTIGVTGDVSVNTNKFNITAANGNTTIAGTLGVTGATTFNATTGAPSYAADPSGADVLSRKSYVDSRTRVGAVVIITCSTLGDTPTIGGSFPSSAITVGQNNAGLTGIPSGWTATITGSTLSVTANGGTWFGCFFTNNNAGASGLRYAYQTGTSTSNYTIDQRSACILLVRTA